jgi:hypothetical protein
MGLILCAFAPLSVFAQMPSNKLEGTWRMVSQERVYPDSTVDRSDEWGANYKILNSTHFAWGRETKDGQEVLAGGGRYEYHPEENVYIEHIEYHSDPGFQDITIRFTARVEGDTWIHIGDVSSYQLKEVWKRVDPDEARQETERNSPLGAAENGQP